MDDKSAVDLLNAFIQSEEMNETANYLERGRLFERLSRQELEDAWARAFRTYQETRGQGQRELLDLSAEFHLRGIEPPYDRVKDEVRQGLAELRSDREIPGLCRQNKRVFALTRGRFALSQRPARRRASRAAARDGVASPPGARPANDRQRRRADVRQSERAVSRHGRR